MPKARINGVEHYYEVFGEGEPFLFIHGGYGGPERTLGERTGQNVYPTVLPAWGIQVIKYDRRSANGSEYVLDHYALEDLAEDARALLDHLGIDRSTVMGHSAGGPIALQMALSHSARVKALCLGDTGPNLMSEERANGRTYVALVRRVQKEGERLVFESLKEGLRNPPAPDWSVLPAEERDDAQRRRDALLAALAAVSEADLFRYWLGMVRNLEAYVGQDLSPRLGEIKMPVCIMHGTADTTVPFASGLGLHRDIPHSEFHPIEGGTHGGLAYDLTRLWRY